MNDIVIKAENLGKMYTIGHQAENGRYIALRDVLMHNARNLWNKTKDLAKGKPIIQGDTLEEVWALKDVSFEIRRGEAVGIIGRNGAGKSTLLKVLSRITEPSTGRVTIKGRVASLLEVGTGFHPELTGRENIYLNGTILGMTRLEIKRKFDEIVAFAEVEKYLDTPVKRYSSGMYVRLAFAVAAHLEPEILLVDEVLAVGDAQFQKKCLGKMGDVAHEGRTVLFVSHNMGAITRLCQRTILLSHGSFAFDGDTEIAVRTYLKGTSLNSVRRVYFPDNRDLPIVILQVAVTTHGKSDTDPLDISDPLNVEIHYQVRQDIKGTSMSFALKRDGILLFRSWDIDSDQDVFEMRKSGHYVSKLALPSRLLSQGEYSIFVGAGQPGIGIITQHDDCLMFELGNDIHDANHSSYSRGGLLIMLLPWKTCRAH